MPDKTSAPVSLGTAFHRSDWIGGDDPNISYQMLTPHLDYMAVESTTSDCELFIGNPEFVPEERASICGTMPRNFGIALSDQQMQELAECLAKGKNVLIGVPATRIGDPVDLFVKFKARKKPADEEAGDAATTMVTSLLSLQSLVEKTYTAARNQFGEKLLRQHLQENPVLTRKALEGIAYGLFADVAPDAVGLNVEEQKRFLKELQGIANPEICRITAQSAGTGGSSVAGLSPADALEKNLTGATHTHFFIRPLDAAARPEQDENGHHARLTLSLPPSHIVAMADGMIPILSEFADLVVDYKVTAAAEQGKRADSIVVYLNQANLGQAKELARWLEGIASEIGAADAWSSHTPLGMHGIRPGIAYGEFNQRSSSSSFGEDRAAIVAEAILRHITSGMRLEKALRDVLSEKGYDPDNPAFIARPYSGVHRSSEAGKQDRTSFDRQD